LSAWAENDQIWAFLKEKDKVIRSNLMGVAQERYFYELISFTDEEESFLKKLVVGMSHPSVKELNLDFFQTFTSHYKLTKQLGDSAISKDQRSFIENEIRKLEVNLMEDSHGKMETSGMKLLAVIDSKNYNFLENQDDFYETMMFLCFQYFRTKKMKINIEKSFSADINFGKFWNIISHVMATTLARNFSFSPDLSFMFYENNRGKTFLTCDQPIFNILSDHVDNEGNPSEIELYYPLSPRLALLISFTPKPHNWINSQIIDEETVDYFNQKVIKYGTEFVFANNREDLEFYR